MNRRDLQNLTKLRLKEAKVLLDNGLYEGSYYLAGYAVECALKACIAKQVQRCHFPELDVVRKSHTHNLEQLVVVAGLSIDRDTLIRSSPLFAANWAVVKDWSEHKRYQLGITVNEAQDLYEAITQRAHGILAWVKRKW